MVTTGRTKIQTRRCVCFKRQLTCADFFSSFPVFFFFKLNNFFLMRKHEQNSKIKLVFFCIYDIRCFTGRTCEHVAWRWTWATCSVGTCWLPLWKRSVFKEGILIFSSETDAGPQKYKLTELSNPFAVYCFLERSYCFFLAKWES